VEFFRHCPKADEPRTVTRHTTVGGCGNGGVYIYCANRFLAGGVIDGGFGQSGKFIAAASGGAQAVVLQPDGRLLLGDQCSHQAGNSPGAISAHCGHPG